MQNIRIKFLIVILLCYNIKICIAQNFNCYLVEATFSVNSEVYNSEIKAFLSDTLSTGILLLDGHDELITIEFVHKLIGRISIYVRGEKIRDYVINLSGTDKEILYSNEQGHYMLFTSVKSTRSSLILFYKYRGKIISSLHTPDIDTYKCLDEESQKTVLFLIRIANITLDFIK